MDTTYTDIREGKRLDIAVEFVTRRVVDCGGERVHRLLVADSSGRQFPVLTTPDSEAPVGLKAGETYRLCGLLGADSETAAGIHGTECPACGGPVRPGQVLDVVDPAVVGTTSELGLENRFGIFDDATTVDQDPGEQGPVDDWVPRPVESPVGLPDRVCRSCGRQVEAETRSDHRADTVRTEPTPERPSPYQTAGAASPESVDLAVGGTGTVHARASVAHGYTPQPATVGDEQVFAGYHPAGEETESDGLFAPHCGVAASDHPITGATERYLSVGLDATTPVEAFERPRLDLVVVLDVSGSMDCPSEVYCGDERERQPGDDASTKLEVATQALCALAGQLRADDRLGIVLCNSRAHVAKPLRAVDSTDVDAVRKHVREVEAGGSTDLVDGYETAVDMFAGGGNTRGERRVVLLSDLLPSTGATAAAELRDQFAAASTRGVHTTVLGVGVGANAQLAATLSEVRGANYRFVHSPAAFERRLDEMFDRMVTPVVYDLTLELDSDTEIAAVHGSPAAAAATDRLVHVGTLFPSIGQHGSVHGGFVLVRLEPTGADPDLELVVSWTERGGGEHAESLSVEMPDRAGTDTGSGVRTAVALARYGRELRSWAADRRGHATATARDHATATARDHATATAHDDDRSDPTRPVPVPLAVSAADARRFERLRSYLEDELARGADGTLQRGVTLLEALCRQAPERSVEVAD